MLRSSFTQILKKLIQNEKSYDKIIRHLKYIGDSDIAQYNSEHRESVMHTIISAKNISWEKKFKIITAIARNYRNHPSLEYGYALYWVVHNSREHEETAEEAVKALLQAGASMNYAQLNYQKETTVSLHLKEESREEQQWVDLKLRTFNPYLAACLPNVSERILVLLHKYLAFRPAKEIKAANGALVCEVEEKVVTGDSCAFRPQLRADTLLKCNESKNKQTAGHKLIRMLYGFLNDKVQGFVKYDNVIEGKTSLSIEKIEDRLALINSLAEEPKKDLTSSEKKNIELNEKTDLYKTKYTNLFEDIYVYFCNTYRPDHPDYRNRLNDFARITAQLTQLYSGDRFATMAEINDLIKTSEIFKAKSYMFFKGTQRYYDLLTKLKKQDLYTTRRQFKEFEKTVAIDNYIGFKQIVDDRLNDPSTYGLLPPPPPYSGEQSPPYSLHSDDGSPPPPPYTYLPTSGSSTLLLDPQGEPVIYIKP